MRIPAASPWRRLGRAIGPRRQEVRRCPVWDDEPVGLYNLLLAELECPRCHERAKCEVEFKLGLLDLGTYRLGDTLRWAGGHRKKPLRRPDAGTAQGAGYAECPHCGKDFWVHVDVRDDRIVAARPDPDRPGYIP